MRIFSLWTLSYKLDRSLLRNRSCTMLILKFYILIFFGFATTFRYHYNKINIKTMLSTAKRATLLKFYRFIIAVRAPFYLLPSTSHLISDVKFSSQTNPRFVRKEQGPYDILFQNILTPRLIYFKITIILS